jgi:5,10-methylenetetrahydromethanopterin reductase
MAALARTTGTAFALRDPYPWGHLAGLARIGESLGYRAMFMPEVGSRDVLAALTGIAGETGGLLLGSGVLPLPGRSPRLLAQAAATAQERSNGRLILGIGTGPAARGALDRLRGTVAMLREAFAGEMATTPEGEPFRLALVPASPPPIWIAALGPRAMRLAGAVGDGVLLNWCTPERVARAREELAEGGRDPAEVTVGVYVRACMHADSEAAWLAVSAAAAQYASYPAYAQQFARMGLGEEAGRAAAAHAAARPADVPEAFVRGVAAIGDPAAARARLEEYRSAGADLVVVYPVVVPGSTLARGALTTLEALAPNG